MAKAEEKPNGKPGGDDAPPSAFDDSEFFASEGITEDEEKDAIRARARVQRYAAWRAAKESEPKKKQKGKPWYRED